MALKKVGSVFSAIPNTAFYFSAISTQEKKNGSINEESEDSEVDHEPSPVPSTFSEQMLNGNPTRLKQVALASNHVLAGTDNA